MAGASRLKSSAMFKVRKRRPEARASLTKSTDHTWLTFSGTSIGARATATRRLRPRFRTQSFSST
jgi:hypothetical protein